MIIVVNSWKTTPTSDTTCREEDVITMNLKGPFKLNAQQHKDEHSNWLPSTVTDHNTGSNALRLPALHEGA